MPDRTRLQLTMRASAGPVCELAPALDTGRVVVWRGDALDYLRRIPDNFVDAVVTDPPYGLGFMGQKWDSYSQEAGRAPTRPAIFDHVGGNHNPVDAADAARTRRVEGVRFGVWCTEWAAECLRVLKPGGHMLAFGGTRTWHRLACAVEDAGFEIRDTITWLYGSGFPKSLDVSKAIDKAAGAEREVVGDKLDWPGYHLSGHDSGTGALGRGISSTTSETRLRAAQVTAPATEDAARWDGWGTALKPASEPIIVARKPLAGTVAANVTTYGTGALNIAATRVGTTGGTTKKNQREGTTASLSTYGDGLNGGGPTPIPAGRWPSNVILTHAPDCQPTGTRKVRGSRIDKPAQATPTERPWAGGTFNGPRPARGHGDADGTETVEAWECVPGCPVAELDAQSGKVGAATPVRGTEPSAAVASGAITGPRARVPGAFHDDEGGASRFFPTFRYQAKADTAQRPRAGRVAHPTVKPLDLMRWLIRLVTPPGGTVLDLFAGSGTTGEAALLEGFNAVLIEREPDYHPLIADRLTKRTDPVVHLTAKADRGEGVDLGLFAFLDEGTTDD